MEKEWYEQCILQGCSEYVLENESFVIYKGFKIVKSEETYFVFDVRSRDIYPRVSEELIELFNKEGFIKSVDKINYDRNKQRVEKLELTITRLEENIKLVEEKLQENVKFYTKKLKNLEVNITENMDLLIFYKSKVKQYEDKNNNK